MNMPNTLPFYAKASLLLVGLFVLVSILSITQGIILPFLYAVILAILISPIVNFLGRKGINRALAIAGVLIIALLVIVSILGLLSSQTSRFSNALPNLIDKFQMLLEQTAAWASGYFNISPQRINTWIAEAKADLMGNSNAAIGNTLSSMGGVLTTVFLTPVYIFMLLFYQPHLVAFIHKVFGTGNDQEVSEVLTETKSIIQSYLVGLFVEFGIIAVLNTIGLLILGIDYAILLGITGAFLNIIPYLGGVITMVLFMVIAMATKTPVYMLYVVGLYALIQLIDNNYIVPKIVGSKVRLNALVSLLTVIAGAALWGIPGMFLAIPITAILKLIFDRIESLKTLGFLLGDTMPPLVKLKLNMKDLSKKITLKK